MSEAPDAGSNGVNLLLWLTTGGGIALLLREARQFWRDRRVKADAKRKAAAAAPEVQAAVESRAVATAKDVIDLVDELVEKRMAPIQVEVNELRSEAADLKARVVVLEDELRAHSIPVPPSTARRTL